MLVGVSDIIARFISKALEEAGGSAELQRCELAQRFGCVPSQINYVISTRFSPEHGYCVESRRGGGGYIRITRVQCDCKRIIMHTVNAVGNEIDGHSVRAFLSNLLDAGVIDDDTACLMTSATGVNALRSLPVEYRDTVRASILKQMLIQLIS